MAITLIGKLIITFVSIAVLGGMSTVVYLVVTDEGTVETPLEFTSSTTTAAPTTDDGRLYVGVGIADMTGPCVEITFMGYAEVGQMGRGIHMRQFARAFIFVKGNTRVVMVSAEVQSVGIAVRREVVRNLQELYGDIYSLRNVIMSGTHTHSTPGGYLVDFLLDVSILGFSQETYDAYVAGITRSIVRAHENMVPATLYYGESLVPDGHANRSPYSYNYNPEEERARYTRNTDDVLTQVRILREDGSIHGVMSWFAVHATSMNMTNQLVSSDNLGYAAITMESALNPGAMPGKGGVVAAFFPANMGDASPNTRGARCEFSGDECDNQFYVCGAQERCFSEGPGEDMFESTRIIGNAIYEGAMEALNSPGVELNGDIAVVHQFIDMPEQIVPRYDPIAREFNEEEQVRGCVPAMGYSFASGTVDGANTLNITQGTVESEPLLDMLSGVVARPTAWDTECHAPKPILLATGRANVPLPWHPRIASATLIWLGGFVVLGVPGEPTTMSGRRMKDVVGSVMEQHGFEPRVVVNGLINEYIHYIATYEEYQVQRYEAASTIYGPHTLDIFLNKFSEFATAAIEGVEVEAGPSPPDYRSSTISLILPVVADSPPRGTDFGHVLVQPPTTVRPGETVAVTFVAANPRNDLKQESSHASVERFEVGQWTEVATDASWETRFYWDRESTLRGTSSATLEWVVPANALRAQYRITYSGRARAILGEFLEFNGVSDPFTVIDNGN